jgi:hypothetical protein
MSLKRASAVAASAVLLGTLATVPASTALAATTAACTMTAGSITGSGDFGYSSVTASSPVTAEQSTGDHVFTPGVAKLSSTWLSTVYAQGTSAFYGNVVLNDTLYRAYTTDDPSQPPTTLTKVGSGWSKFTAIEESFYWGATQRSATYGLRNDGVLFRWTDSFKRVSSYAGFGAVKTMALISETKTYDTFLATTRGGALYTIRIPATTPMKPIVKQVRASTWGSFEHLVAQKCGAQSTLLTAIDKDTGSAYLYAVSHANGTSTVIRGLGKVPGTYKDPVYYLSAGEGDWPLFGE